MRRALLFAGAALIGSGLSAQRSPDISQIADAQPAGSAAQAPEQISSGPDGGLREVQLTGAAASRQEPSQLTDGAPSAQASMPLSRPSDGRAVGVERLEGSDRCDPAVPEAKRQPDCKRVIESRADDYATPRKPELTPEQHLLLDQEARESDGDGTDATRRLAATGEADNSPETLAIASIVLGQKAPPPKEPDKHEDPTTQSAVQALVQMITQAPPQ